MTGDMTRNPGAVLIDVGTSVGNSQAIPMQDFAGAIIHIPSAEVSVTTLTIYVGDTDDDTATFRALYDYAGNAVAPTVTADTAIELHPATFSALQVKIVADAISSGTSVQYPVTLKS